MNNKSTYYPGDFKGENVQDVRRNICNAVAELMAMCINEKDTYRIILEVKDCESSNYQVDTADYYMIDFSACGEAFEDDTKAMVSNSLDGEDYKVFKSYHEAFWWLRCYLANHSWECVYVESF